MTDAVEPLAATRAGQELRSWIEANWNPELSLVEWRTRLADSGWACPTWPLAWCGRALPAAFADMVSDEIARAGAVGVPDGVGMRLVAPTILEHGSDDLKRRLIRSTQKREITWCQPQRSPVPSDLAGLTTRAEPDGDEWVVNGQKVWTTSATHADYGLLAARTDRDVPKHEGITSFVIPMHQTGAEVRPLRQMNGHASFNEVYFDDARIPAGNLVGEVGHGWAVALTTLAHERRYAFMGQSPARAPTDGRA